MDAQTIFDTVATHLTKQGRQALDAEGACVYLAPNGDRCSGGCLMTKRLYQKEMEGRMFGSQRDPAIDTGAPIKWPEELMGHRFLIMRLQTVHDTFGYWQSGAAMTRSLTSVALDFSLSPAILSTLDWSAIGR